MTEVDVSDPAAPKVARTMTIDGRFVDARQHGGTARLVVDDEPQPIAEPQDATKTAFVGRTVLKSNLSGHTFTHPLAPCDAIRRPAQFSGLGLLAILTIDLDRGMYSLDRDGVLAGAEAVYGSPDALYVASRRYAPRLEAGTAVPDEVTTEIDRFDISDPDKTTYVASGSVPGFILNSYALSEYDGDLRVATHRVPAVEIRRCPAPRPRAPSPSCASTAPRSTKVGAVGGLGKGERIYAVRFLGDRGYVVTFQPDRPAVHARPLRPGGAGRARASSTCPATPPTCTRSPTIVLLGIGRIGADGQGGAVRRLRSGRAEVGLRARPRPGRVGGREQPARVPLLAADQARGPAVRRRPVQRRGRAARRRRAAQ